MSKDRLEAFSDGVIAILITIMMLELHAPLQSSLQSLNPVLPVLGCYVLSFVFIGIYWSNHHHLLQLVRQINGAILWANLHLLFWLSLIPFVTEWMGGNQFATWPVALYGVVLLMCGIAFTILARALIKQQGPDSALASAIGRDLKGNASLVAYAVAIPLAFVARWLSLALYIMVALMWLVPDRRIERQVRSEP